MAMGVRRDDIDIHDVVYRWLFRGESMLSIATAYDCDASLINQRISRARQMWPDLPWAERKARRAISPTAEWVKMMDGKAGERETAGSIVDGRRRGR